MMGENNTQSNPWRQKLVLYVDGKNKITNGQLALERGGEPPHNGWKNILSPSCMRKTNNHDPREWEEWSLRHGEESKCGRGSGLLASQLLPQLTKGNNQERW